MKPVIVWFRRDLRIDDNPALHHAAATGAPVVPLFIFDTDLIPRIPSDGAAFNFQSECLEDLAHRLRKLGGKLVCRKGSPLTIHRDLIAKLDPAALYFNRDYDPAASTRDREVTALWQDKGRDVHTFPDVVAHEPDEIMTNQGTPYVMFTPYSRRWKQLEPRPPLPSPKRIMTPEIAEGAILDAGALGRRVSIEEPIARGGQTEAETAWRRFRRGRIGTYDNHRNFPGTDGTSRLSPYLRFGCLSVRRMVDDLSAPDKTNTAGASKFLDELIWRDFYIAVLYHFPRLRTGNYRQEFDHFKWDFDESVFTAWKEGKTGYPFVDAGMRQLNRRGWMHNRLRMVTASFLTKHLMHDWKLGESVFEEKLMDIEVASNNGGWQWSASTGVDPRPLRIFNPTLQAGRYDPEGSFIRSFVPELRNVPQKYIHAPQTMPEEIQKEVGCILGTDYPLPIVDHREASERYRRAFRRVRSMATA